MCPECGFFLPPEANPITGLPEPLPPLDFLPFPPFLPPLPYAMGLPLWEFHYFGARVEPIREAPPCNVEKHLIRDEPQRPEWVAEGVPRRIGAHIS